MAKPPLKANLGFGERPSAEEALALAQGMQAVIPTMDAPPKPPPKQSGAKRDRPARKVTMDFPGGVHFELAQRALEENTSMTVLVLRALKLAGYAVPEDYLVDARRSNTKK